MFDAEESKWVKSTANELNNLLQVIIESTHFLETNCELTADTQKYFDILRNGAERATQVTRLMLERVLAYEQGGEAPQVFDAQKPKPAFSQQPAAQEPPPKTGDALDGDFSDIKIVNPGGVRELILIVDDEAFVTLLAQRVLTDDGYRVITARDGFECLNIYKRLKDKISLIIMDFTMPIMDGAEVFDELRLINPRVCVVLSSGFTEQEKLRGMLAKGLRGFIPKPYTQQKLLLQVRSTLDTLKSER
jgi:CheY-like chemotaxis protein